MCGITRFPHDRHARKAGNNFLEQFQPFPSQFLVEVGDPRHIAAWPSEAGDKPRAHGISHYGRDDGNGRGRLLRGDRSGRANCDNHVHVETQQFGREARKSLVLSIGTPGLEADISAFNVAKFSKVFLEGLEEMFASGEGPSRQDTYPLNSCGLLRLSPERRKNEGDNEKDREADQPHAAGSLADATTRTSAPGLAEHRRGPPI